MAGRPRDQPEPSYWSNAFRFWYTNYTDSKFRAGLIKNDNFMDGEVDSHDIEHHSKHPSTKRQKRREYASPKIMKYPRECAKEINKFAECKKSYGVYGNTIDVPQCDWAKELIFEGCPHWALEYMSLSKRFNRRAEKIDQQTYLRAMEVSDYNKKSLWHHSSNQEVGLAALILGPEVAQQLYGSSVPMVESVVRSISPATSPFLQRLREALTHCCTTVGVETTFKHLMLPVAVGQYLVESCVDSGNAGVPGKKLKVANAFLPPEVTPEEDIWNCEEEEQREPVGITEETKQKIIRLYQKGIRVTYLAELFNVESPKLIHSWGNWSKRPQPETERNLQRREQIQTLLSQGETPKAICLELRLKPKNYREILGIPSGPIYSRAIYEKVMQQMQIVKIKNTVSKNTGVSVYIINKWIEGKDVPDPDTITDDEEGTRDIKRLAVETFYESGSAAAAANTVKKTPALVKKWVIEFQRGVDGKMSRSREPAAESSAM